jgi:hypothetical protein
MDAADALNCNFFKLARIPMNDNTIPIVFQWVYLKREADARARVLMERKRKAPGGNGSA